MEEGLEGYVTTGLSHDAQRLCPWTHRIHSLSWKQLEKWQRCIQDVSLLIHRIYLDAYNTLSISLSLSRSRSPHSRSLSLHSLSLSLHSRSLSLSIKSDAINPLAPAR